MVYLEYVAKFSTVVQFNTMSLRLQFYSSLNEYNSGCRSPIWNSAGLLLVWHYAELLQWIKPRKDQSDNKNTVSLANWNTQLQEKVKEYQSQQSQNREKQQPVLRWFQAAVEFHPLSPKILSKWQVFYSSFQKISFYFTPTSGVLSLAQVSSTN